MSLYLAFFIVLSCLVCLKCLYFWYRRTMVKSLKNVLNYASNGDINVADVRALIVTAHPDDECMFFAPAIIRLVELNATVHLLCLSEGDFYNQGTQRKQELLNSCAVLGIPHSRITIVHHKKLADDPKAEWSVSLVSSVIMNYMRAHYFNMVLTFDGRGVSGHANHIAIHKAFRSVLSTLCELNNLCTPHFNPAILLPLDKFLMEDMIPSVPKPKAKETLFGTQTSVCPALFHCCLFSLVTVSLIRKYTSFLDLPISCLLPSGLCCFIGSQGYRKARNAMLCHRTQLLWFRYLYITFSRYMFINTFEMIPKGPKNLKIY